MSDLLRKQWGFDGLLVTDYTAMNELVQHGVGNEYEVAGLSLNAEVDMDMVGELYLTHLKQLLKDGKVTEAQIDHACRRILETKYKLGLFDDPYRYANDQRAAQTMLKKEFREAAREASRKSFVLLKNDNVLPLKKDAHIALVGPLAKNQRDLIGNWSAAGDWHQAVSVEQGIKNVAGASVK